ncbi:hypothetical protein OFQ45_10485 [Brachyspira hyodysenteriae]|uniref:hypothetical protein n=1 Tax=Brachyspira hyodysenteriae TaxID=159 RepID=UPI0022CD3978|nr:hypothetical protein [Brachyspira hyodysenteriae]MCZ9840646.1 hypothetical protein [Brachyspira hyodysenteriae]MCZ9849624.1 hypothetical protein [Brachyspira hyodysenteriae]MCZ9852447.1 hypothetical protein [Brachyspira hyodysenteriae]MCZ9862089.1 hypothetical protein [Brachyspira hyodysenteriae]MCZ9871552.1 hypothetical protein [Brachyspira hyodysenteriae]
MREVNFIEDKGRFGITFMSDDKVEANTVMNAIQRFILKNSNNEISKKTEIKNDTKYIEEEINKRKNKSFEDTLKENNEIISFGEDEDDSNYRIDEENEEDPLSSGIDEDNINRWDFDADGDKVDSEGNKMLFADEE